MRKLILIPLLVMIVFAQTYSIINCVCSQLKSNADCIKLGGLNCSWDSTNSKCTTSTTVTPTNPTYASYCDPYSQTVCQNTTGCAWVSSKCTFFTGCTAFAKTTDGDCKTISSKCITDGTHCVEKSACDTYLKVTPCVKNAAGAYCYWDTTNNVCVDADSCDKLPAFLASDLDCRTQIATCTAKTGGGCQDSGINCNDQTTKISCVWNKIQNQACYWTGTVCVDKICANAPNTLTTDDTCTSFTTDGTCTAKSSGKCVTRTTCQAATIQAACVKSSSGSLCYWNGTTCVDKICTNAPATMTTNSACQGFISTCITTGTGCTNNGSCSVATAQAACEKNVSGGACIWNTTCKDKTCTNAPSTNTTHDLCTSYLSSCTVNSAGNGCQTRSCDNAPTTITSNDDCEAYLPGSNCVAKSDGGCVTNSSCSALSQTACVKDISGNDCFWDTTCKDKTCANAPSSANTHALCQDYLKTCTVNSSGTCVSQTCENIQTSDICTNDFNGKPCIYKNKCYKIQCAQAKTQTTHTDCQSFSTECTLSNTGTGCVPIPLSCSAITIQAACYLRQSQTQTAQCGWNGSKCIDIDCSTLDKTITTSAACASALAGCTSANPVNGSVSGCMEIPTTCSARLTQDNCEVTGRDTICLWDRAGNGSCVEKSCITATITTTTGYISSINNTNCARYWIGCFLNNTGDGCMGRVTACNLLTTSTSCNYTEVKIGGACYWNSTACVDKTCANIPLTSHSACQGVLNTCTVNSAKTSCQAYAACNTYTLQEQCGVNATGKRCYWTGTACRDQVCTDADTTFITSAGCAALTLSGTTLCNVIPRVQSRGCMTRQASCSDYTKQSTCVKDISLNDCYWQGGACWLKSAFTCANIKIATYSVASCEGVISSCTTNVTNTGCQTKVCSDYNTQTGLIGGAQVYKDEHCSGVLSICTIDQTIGAVKCQPKQDMCFLYTTSGTCTFATEGQCYWNVAVCVLVTCTANPLTSWAIADCEGLMKSCKNNNGSTACQTKVCSDYTTQNGKTGGVAVSTDAHCKALNSQCTIDSTVGAVKCQTKQNSCSLYTTNGTCTIAFEGTCVWTGGACAKLSCTKNNLTNHTIADCEGLFSSCINNGDSSACQTKVCSDYTTQNGKTGGVAVFTDAHCYALNYNCTIDTTVGAVKCQNTQGTCSQYTTQGQCTVSEEGTCYWTGNACAFATTCASLQLVTYNILSCENAIGTCTVRGTACQTKVCTDYTTQNGYMGGYPIEYDADCSALLDTCTIDKTVGAVKCQTKQATCSLYTTSGTCSKAIEGTCIWAGSACVFRSASNCALETGNNLTDALEDEILKMKFLQLYISFFLFFYRNQLLIIFQIKFDFYNCAAYHTGCTVNSTGTACQARAATCLSQSSNACYRAVEGECIVLGTLCHKKTCDNAPIETATDEDCNNYLSTCTLARTGGCITRQACNLYISELQCTFNASSQACYWSYATYTCLDLTCANIDQTSSYNTHSKCNYALNTCTVRASNGVAMNGCQSLGACASYTIQDQCNFNSTGGECKWNTNLVTPACVVKTCSTAPSSNITHDSCMNYRASSYCTVRAVAGTNGAANTLGGCISLGACSSYIDAEQCKINDAGGTCGWNGTICADQSCKTAPSTTNSNTQCSSYKAGCTVDQSGSGCMALLSTCESYQIQGNCLVDTQGNSCYWNSTTTKCVTKTCDNAPDSVASASDCNAFLAGCTMDSVKCKPKICEDFQLTTDALCKASLSECTTDGMKCVLRGTCFKALDQTGCVTDSNGNQCEWVPAASVGSQPYCTVKTCLTAPITNTTESQCAAYFTNCTTKNGGGCVIKSTCSAANVQAACTVASDGTKCQWDTSATPNICRNKDCQDYQGSTHAACQAINSVCTAGTNGNCSRIKSCANTTVRSACIQGTDGPCLWIAGVTNSDGTTGACYPYTSCKSLTWNSDNKCKLISSNCTTNGSNCLGISLCTETNVSGGCVTGYDGNCIQTVSSLGSTDAPVCKAFTSCTDAFYSTHSGCQTANSKCTTNGTTGCTPFAACSTYAQAGCYVNAAGPQKNTGYIISTGVCTWDSNFSHCRDQYCSDLTGSNHAACVAQLATCTSDGTACLQQEACEQYTQAQCGVAIGTDGNCIWQVETEAITIPICRVMTCDDVTNGTTTAVCQAGLSGCVSTGTICINKTDCQHYATKTSCNSGGLDGICFFTASTITGATLGTGRCSLMTSCASASNDQYACNLAKSRCSWKAASENGATSTASKCATHTCASYYATNNVCSNFLNWGQNFQQICQIKNGVCTETDPTTFNATDCYSASSYTYTWNASTSKCGVCAIQTANNSNNPNTSIDTITDSGFVLSFATVVFGYLVI